MSLAPAVRPKTVTRTPVLVISQAPLGARSPSQPQTLTRWVLSPSTHHKGPNQGPERASPSLKGTWLARWRGQARRPDLVYVLSRGPIWPLFHREVFTKRTWPWPNHENRLKRRLEAVVSSSFPDPHRRNGRCTRPGCCWGWRDPCSRHRVKRGDLRGHTVPWV